jgi:tripartite-type tricarboxylate transporter receptor subunit TctC
MMGRKSALAASLGAGLLLAATATAQDDPAKTFPKKPIRIIVGYSPGGANDILARLVGQKMGESFGQPVVVENHPGAQSIIAAEMVAKAPPDGHTLLMGASGPIVVNPATYAKLPYSPLASFAPVTMIGSFPLILLVGETQPFRSVAELVDFAKAHPEQANYSASAASFQLATELFKQKTGTEFVYIAYKGSADSINAVLAGEVTMTLVDSGPALIAMRSGRGRALAVTQPSRLAAAPDIATMAEAGIAGLDVAVWSGLLAPSGTPPSIIARLQQEVARILKLPDIEERAKILAMQPIGNTPEEFRRIIAAEIEQWTAVARRANIPLN